MTLKNEIITSRNNPFVKWAASLSDKKGRAAAESFFVEGEKLTLEALEYGLPVTHIIITEAEFAATEKKLGVLLSKPCYKTVEVKIVSDGVFEKISTEKSPQGVITIIKYLDFFRKVDIIYKEEFFISNGERALFLCSVRDPLNLGAVIRCAVALGVSHIVLSSDCADVYNPRTVRCAMGSLFKVKITIVKDTVSFIRAARANSRRVLAAELRDGAVSLGDIGLRASDIIIIGNEGHGIPEEISAACDASVYIPISKDTESLNASSAATVFMWEQSKAL